jgi:hemerythrin
MALITWSSAYSVGIPEIDSQHQRLVRLTNELHDAMITGSGAAALGKILDDLIAYTRGHFATEERMMQAKHFDGYAAHKMEHDRLTAKVLTLQREFKAGRMALSIEVLQFLKLWLDHHILGTDKKYMEALAPPPTLAQQAELQRGARTTLK